MKSEKSTAKKKSTVKAKAASTKKTTKTSAAKKTTKNIVAKAKEVKAVEEVKEVKEVKVVKESKSNHTLFKTLTISILLAVVLSWIIPSGYFEAETFTEGVITRTGVNELFLSLFYSSNYYLLQVMFVLMVGIFYGVIRNTNGYKSLVDKLVSFWTGKEKIFVIVNTLIIALYVSIATQSFPILLFVPLIMTIAYRLGFTKINSFLITFGSILVGMVGQTYSTYGLDYVTYSMGTTLSDGIAIRFGILGVAYILLNCLIFLTTKKNDKMAETVENDVFVPTSDKKGSALGYGIFFFLLFALIVLGYTPWKDAFSITVFEEFYTKITTEVVISIAGKDHAIISYILGKITAFGQWDIFTIGYISIIGLLIIKVCSKIKFDDFLDYAVDGVKKMVKPALLVAFAYAMFVICYWSGFTGTIVEKIMLIGSTVQDNVTTYTFNPATNALANAIATFFHVDFGFTGYSLSGMYAARFADNTNIITCIMTSINGLVSIVAPTSVVLVTGLGMYDIPYTKWLKAIWKYVLILLAILLGIFLALTYI